MAPDHDGEDTDAPGASPQGDGESEDMIARNLKRMFQSMEGEALPEHLQTLLKRLEDEERRDP